MDDIMAVYRQEIKEKKLAATGARHRATRGKRSFTVHNQSDHLTKKQLREMSGEVTSYNLNRPMTKAEFDKLPMEARKNYLTHLINTFNASIVGLSNMFGCCRQTTTRTLKNLGIEIPGRGNHMSNKELIAWNNFINGDAPPEAVEEPTVESVIYPVTEEPGVSHFGSVKQLVFESADKEVLADEFRRLLTYVAPDSGLFRVTIEVRG